jgi:hypothetical protein
MIADSTSLYIKGIAIIIMMAVVARLMQLRERGWMKEWDGKVKR